jgi:hypothetical protein
MSETINEATKPVSENETDREVTDQEIAEVTGGFNPQPDPPGADNRA